MVHARESRSTGYSSRHLAKGSCQKTTSVLRRLLVRILQTTSSVLVQESLYLQNALELALHTDPLNTRRKVRPEPIQGPQSQRHRRTQTSQRQTKGCQNR